MRPSKLHKISCSQVGDCIDGNNRRLWIKGRLGSANGTSKNACGGWKDVGGKPKEVTIFDEDV